MISSITSRPGGKVALGTAGDNSYAPPVDYNPGENPDIVSIELGENKFKESTTPLPDVIRADELVETRFDVVTYSQNDDGATFLRREEFRAVSCECTLRIPSSCRRGRSAPDRLERHGLHRGRIRVENLTAKRPTISKASSAVSAAVITTTAAPAPG